MRVGRRESESSNETAARGGCYEEGDDGGW